MPSMILENRWLMKNSAIWLLRNKGLFLFLGQLFYWLPIEQILQKTKAKGFTEVGALRHPP